MELQFHGATGNTTGSCHMIKSQGRTVLLDCGMFQGRRDDSYRRNAHFGFDPASVGAVVQSHAHVDHSGKLPMLVRHGFQGAIHATSATRDLCAALLLDSAHIAEQDAYFMNRRRLEELERRARRARREERERGRHHRRGGEQSAAEHEREADEADAEALNQPLFPSQAIEPLFLEADVEATLKRFELRDYHQWFEAVPGMRFCFHDAGHILGSCWVEAEIEENGRTRRLVFTGDYGRSHQPILRDPEPLLEADIVISESTYGNRHHPPHEELEHELAAAVRRLSQRGRGRLLIPAFAVGRTQNVLYALSRIFHERMAPPVDVVVDSPLATEATRIVWRHTECFDDAALAEFRRLQEADSFRARLRFTESVDESKALNRDPRPLIVISASGMMETGRILHHLAWNVSSPDTEVLVVGFQAPHTLGRRLLEGAPSIRIHGIMHTVRARVTAMLGFSAHADREELVQALAPLAARAQVLFLVHGENEERRPLAAELAQRGFRRIEMPESDSLYSV